jgi:hypothetical protein
MSQDALLRFVMARMSTGHVILGAEMRYLMVFERKGA